MDDFLKQLSKYVDLNDDEKSLLLSKVKERTYLKNQYIVQAGDIAKYQTFIVSGTVRTFYLDNNGTDHIVSFGIENWWVGDICSFTTKAPADYNVQCLENTNVIQISYEDLELLYAELPKMERFFRLMIQSAYAKTQKRLIDNHALSARERYLNFFKDYPNIVQRVPQYMIASYLGVTKEFLSSIRNQISKES